MATTTRSPFSKQAEPLCEALIPRIHGSSFICSQRAQMRTIVEVTEGAGHTRKKACVAQTNYSIRGFEDRASKKLNANFMARQRPKCYICTSKSGRSDDLFSISPSNESRAITRKFSSQLRRVP